MRRCSDICYPLLVLTAFVFLVVSVGTPWYRLEVQGDLNGHECKNITLLGWRTMWVYNEGHPSCEIATGSYEWTRECKASDNTTRLNPLLEPVCGFRGTSIAVLTLMSITLLCGTLITIFTFLNTFIFYEPREIFRKWSVKLSALCGLLLFVSVVVYGMRFTRNSGQKFGFLWDESDIDVNNHHLNVWHGPVGWALAAVACLIYWILAMVFHYLGHRIENEWYRQIDKS
ncbi:hypothetical protein PROFUN_12286 [Planoprotostelium fungivorum]|uniref:Uncharacterized protein n=1 Tax=Planoprotostelium fungivorum TaxID=1890364 RepID=A0A2P6N7S7_9EUKA|nr:hypothetical protein PROFUN_12286 [Planoprotostelium fungivorum]